MSRYVKCRKNDTYFKDDLAQTFADLAVGYPLNNPGRYVASQDAPMGCC